MFLCITLTLAWWVLFSSTGLCWWSHSSETHWFYSKTMISALRIDRLYLMSSQIFTLHCLFWYSVILVKNYDIITQNWWALFYVFINLHMPLLISRPIDFSQKLWHHHSKSIGSTWCIHKSSPAIACSGTHWFQSKIMTSSLRIGRLC